MTCCIPLKHHDQGNDMASPVFGYKLTIVIQAQVCISKLLAQQQAGWALPSLALLVSSMLCIASKSLAMYRVNSCKQYEPG